MHQIRVHLKSIGHPIANDVKYGGILFNDIHIPEVETKHESTNLAEEGKEETKSSLNMIEGGQSCNNSEVYSADLIKDLSLQFWLHAYKYTFKDETYETSIPEWAKKDYKIAKVFGIATSK